MNEKEMIEIIKEIAECNKDSCKDCKSICNYYSAITLFCEKVLPEGSVVLTEMQYNALLNNQSTVISIDEQIKKEYEYELKQARKETAKEIAFTLESRLAYFNNEDTFTKSEILFQVKDILKEKGIEVE